MYSSELHQYIRERNGVLNREETKFIIDVKLHPQINHIQLNSYDCSYDMWDCEGNHYHFSVKQEV